MINKELFSKWIALIAEITGKELTDDVRRFYYEELSESFSDEEFEKRAREVARSAEFFPTVEEFLGDRDELNYQERAKLAWSYKKEDLPEGLKPDRFDEIDEIIDFTEHWDPSRLSIAERLGQRKKYINQYRAMLKKIEADSKKLELNYDEQT